MADDYKLSMFVKEELPTWGEMHEWYTYLRSAKHEYAVHYTPGTEDEIERYWKIPRQLYLMTLICNQMNKMLIEDGYGDQIKSIVEDNMGILIDQIRFVLCPDGNLQYTEGAIYSLQNPRDNPFIFEPGLRIKVDPDKVYQLTFVVQEQYDVSPPNLNATSIRQIMDLTFTILFHEVKKYFKEPIGWKDELGNLISDKTKSIRCESGMDPAL